MMSIYAGRERTKLSYKILSAFIAFTFSFTSVVPPSYAQSLASLNLPVPGAMISPSAAFVPVLLKGMTIYPDNPLQFDFIIDSGNTDFKEDQVKEESQRLVKYFLASMTIPKDDLWVNLSPYEKDRIIPDELGKTELGRDMLAQDYILKQLTASLMYPEKELGKEFWNKVYKQAQEKFGTTEIPVDTFNKVWILPETATVYEHGQTVYIVEAKLRVMLDSDYLAMTDSRKSSVVSRKEKQPLTTYDLPLTTQIVKEIILPEIEKEVNEGQNFAPLRQIYHSLILAKWYKETIKNSLLSKVYVDQNKIAGVNIDDATLKDQIYAQYMEAYKKGVFNYIKEDYDRLSSETIPRKYFSGGEQLTQIPLTKTNNPVAGNGLEGKGHRVTVINTPQKNGAAIPRKSRSPVSMNDLLNVPTGLIGAVDNEGWNVSSGTVSGGGSSSPLLLGDLITSFMITNPGLFTALGMGVAAGWYSFRKSSGVDPGKISLKPIMGLTAAAIIANYFYSSDEYNIDFITSLLVGPGLWALTGMGIGAGVRGINNNIFDSPEGQSRFSGLVGMLAVISLFIGPQVATFSFDRASSKTKMHVLENLITLKEPPKVVIPFMEKYQRRYVQSIIKALDDEDAQVRLKAAKVLELYGVETDIPTPSSSPITPQEAQALIKGKLAPERHYLIDDTHVQLAMAYEGNFEVVYHAGPPESIEIVREKKPDSSSSPVVEQQGQGSRVMGQGITSDEIRNTSDEVGGIDLNAIDLDREGGGVDIQFDPAELQELIDAGIDGFAPVIINITPLPSVLPLLGLDPANKEDPLELSSSG